MQLTSAAFRDGHPIPRRYTGDGENDSPPLAWTAPPHGTKSFVVLCEDPDAPAGTWRHWAVFDIPADRRNLAEALPREAAREGLHQGQNDFHRLGYDGPAPPRGHGTHHYHFRLIALSAEGLGLGSRPTCAAVAAAARDFTLGVAELTGTYAR